MKPQVTNHLKGKAARYKQPYKLALPSIITGCAGDDPPGVLTYTIVAATSGLSRLCLLMFTPRCWLSQSV